MKLNKKWTALLVCAALLLTITVSGTVAYLVDKTNALVNTFTPTHVTTHVTDEMAGNTKKNVNVHNTSNIPVYMRVAVVANWVKDGKIVQAWNSYDALPIESTKWTGSGNGVYYYNGTVPANTTVTLFNSYTATGGPEGAHLEMDIIAQVIQAEGMDVTSAQDAFSKAAQSN